MFVLGQSHKQSQPINTVLQVHCTERCNLIGCFAWKSTTFRKTELRTAFLTIAIICFYASHRRLYLNTSRKHTRIKPMLYYTPVVSVCKLHLTVKPHIIKSPATQKGTWTCRKWDYKSSVSLRFGDNHHHNCCSCCCCCSADLESVFTTGETHEGKGKTDSMTRRKWYWEAQHVKNR